MAVEMSKFVGRWRVNRVDKIVETIGIELGDTIEIISESPNNASLLLNGKAFAAELREEGLCCDLVSDTMGPMALQISVYQQFEPGQLNYFRALYATAIKKNPDNVGVWGAEEDEDGVRE